MRFRNKQNNKPELHFRIEIDDKHIEKVEVTKFWGILTDNNLSWKAHTNHITKIVSKWYNQKSPSVSKQTVSPYALQYFSLTLINIPYACMGRQK